MINGFATEDTFDALPTPVSGRRPWRNAEIATPIAASGFSPRALAFLGERFRPLGMAPMAGGAAPERVIREEGTNRSCRDPLEHRDGDRRLRPLRHRDGDLTSKGTGSAASATRCSAWGACEFPMMTGCIHTVYPRASVSMKMGSSLKVVGILDTDVSTGVAAGHLGGVPDMLPLSVRVKTGRYLRAAGLSCEDRVAGLNLLATLVMTVLTNAIDTEGNLPEELTAKIKSTIKLKGNDPIELTDTLEWSALHRADGGRQPVQPDRLDRQHPGPEPHGSDPARVDRL